MALLSVGQKAPDFSLKDISGRVVELSGTSGYVLLVFLRYAGCPWCNLAVHRLTLEHKLLKESRCRVITIVQSSKTNIVENIINRHETTPDFPIIPDQQMRIFKKYGIAPSFKTAGYMLKSIPYWVHAVRKGGFKQKNLDGNLFIAPAMFLLKPGSQEILIAEYKANLYSHSTFTRVYEKIQQHDIQH